ncbi:hypothetical protein [Paraburkholderia sp. SOS3]|uniref:hypothetical protein n=1 Tax=Paraburkholderia sp. SOS3 TaxID=1926494 RepID=UPI0009475A06|nr:hypothetical protein [Paraburkholderia sp. SOS3]APR38542.1 hypothetical protein BTO02_24060 [Paraburkholderia sp. SOS3]
MTDNDNPKLNGVFHSYMTPSGYTQRAEATRTVCDLNVPPAAGSIIGQCEYYYRPLHCAYKETVEKLPSFNELVDWARNFNSWSEEPVVAKLLGKRDRLVSPECTDSDWSRHSSFMLRHIGCGHKPPSYYLSYGYYYCSNYGERLKPMLSDRGKAWLAMARKKLQENMEDGLSQNMRGDGISMASRKPGNGSFAFANVKQRELELNDDNFKTFAFATHPLAYLDAGLSDLPLSDLIRIAGQPSIEEWRDTRTWGQAVESGYVVAKDWVVEALSLLVEK